MAKKGNGDDDHGHGTHVAGIIAAANNNVGVVGVAYNTKIMAVKAGQASGYFLQTDICKAIDYARENGADVINMSFGGSASTIAVQDALEAAYTHSVLVAAAGNDGMPNEGIISLPSYPAAFSFVLGVMAVDDYGVETGFTNYDVKEFNSVEYEVYAPGSAIVSTIPNDRYATWNGTSMAAPIVSGMAAVLRSYFDDPDMYPTKFIYGQIASTSERHAVCYDPREHKEHNLPQIANLYDALTKLPEPELSVSDYTVFDTMDIDDNNNGDGTIDAGEVVTLGFELRNRWGMSKETIVTIDALSPADIPNPYVEFSSDGEDFGDSASIDYDSVGTYSTQDCGKIIEDDLWTGWENPFYVKVRKDAPNDTILAINVTIECKNGIDKNDDTVYRFGEYPPITIELIVKNGVVLPQVIDEDMVLTKDNYYIIPNSTVIEEGATVTVTEGTNIQFWTDDKNDAYADSYMASLAVKGKLECIGTEEEPVKIFPSDLMGNYRVEIYESGNGKIYYAHTTITNLNTGYYNNTYNGFTKAENCEFNVNYKDALYYRYLSSGQVQTSYRKQCICGGYAKNCAFYKIGGSEGSFNASQVNIDSMEGCIFVDSNIDFSENATYKNCVFYGYNNYWDSTTEGGTSSMEPMKSYCYDSVYETVRDETTGKIYMQVEIDGYDDSYLVNTLGMIKVLAEYIGGHLVYIETEEELEFLKSTGLVGMVGSQRNENGEFEWMNGEALGDFIKVNNSSSPQNVLYLYKGELNESCAKRALIEIPGEIDVEEIVLKDEAISVDTAVNYRIAPEIYPSTAADEKLLYFSSNEAVATVDEEGLVTPIATGVATIYVFSEDMQVNASMEIDVVDEVKAESIEMPERLQINIGEEAELNAKVYPKNYTKGAVTYESSDESIVEVNKDGVVTANEPGEVIITARVKNSEKDEVVAETVVTVVVPVEEIYFEDEYIITKLNDENDIMPVVLPDDATVKSCKWESSNDNVCYVDENGELVKVGVGIAILKATSDSDETISDTITVVVVDDDYVAQDIVSIQTEGNYSDNTYALLEDGTIWKWGCETSLDLMIAEKLDIQFDEVIDDFFVVNDYNGNLDIAILSDGVLYEYSEVDGTIEIEIAEVYCDWAYHEAKNVTSFFKRGEKCYFTYNHTYDDGRYLPFTFEYDTENTMKPIEIIGAAEDIYVYDNEPYSYGNDVTTFFLDDSNVYVTGHYNGLYYSEPTLVLNGVEMFDGGYAVAGGHYILNDTALKRYDRNGGETLAVLYPDCVSYYINSYMNKCDYELFTYKTSSIEDYEDWRNYTGTGIIGVSEVFNNVGKIGFLGHSPFPALYYKTFDNELFAWYGEEESYQIILGVEYEDAVPHCDENSFNLTDVTFAENGDVVSSVLKDDKIVVDFNTTVIGELFSNNYNLYNSRNEGIWGDDYIDGSKIIVDLQDPIKNGNIVPGEEYLLKFRNVENTQGDAISMTITFTYQPEEIEEEPTEEETGEEVHVHDFATETVMPTVDEEGRITNKCECGEEYETVLPKMTERDYFSAEDYEAYYNEFVEKGFNTNVTNSAILNRLIDDDVTKWLRITAPSGEKVYGFGGNYWGTTNETLINHQIIDYNDFIQLGDINEGEYLTVAPEETFPFVTNAYLLDEDGYEQTVVANGKVRFVVEFNRDMDTEYGLNVYFGSTYPYADYEVYGDFTDERTWVGETTLKTVIENGYQFIRVTNGRAAEDEDGNHLKLYNEWARFGFEIDTTSAMAMMMQGYADNEGIHLEWMQDDYDTLAGYNVYRSDKEDGNYVRINKTIIPSEENTYVDYDVEPGKRYYYTFTVVLTDVSSESKPAGKIEITAKDTMAPDVYHSPVYTATTGNKIIVSATVSDNIGIASAKLYYRVKGEEGWKSADMTATNDKYTAAIPASSVTMSGVEYYIAAYDGVSYTYAGGRTNENPYEVTVYQAVENNAKGDVDGDGNITVLDALKLLRAIYDESLLTQEEFLRADIDGNGTLSAVEALRILQYANKSISSVLW